MFEKIIKERNEKNSVDIHAREVKSELAREFKTYIHALACGNPFANLKLQLLDQTIMDKLNG